MGHDDDEVPLLTGLGELEPDRARRESAAAAFSSRVAALDLDSIEDALEDGMGEGAPIPPPIRPPLPPPPTAAALQPRNANLEPVDHRGNPKRSSDVAGRAALEAAAAALEAAAAGDADSPFESLDAESALETVDEPPVTPVEPAAPSPTASPAEFELAADDGAIELGALGDVPRPDPSSAAPPVAQQADPPGTFAPASDLGPSLQADFDDLPRPTAPPPSVASAMTPASPAPLRRGLFSIDTPTNFLVAAAIGLAITVIPAKKIAESHQDATVAPLIAELESSVDQPLAVAAGNAEKPAAIRGRIEDANGDTQQRYWLIWLAGGLALGAGLGFVPRPGG